MRRLMALCAGALVALALGGAALAQGLPEVRLGNEAFREGDFARAVSHYTNAIRSGELVGEALAITYNNRGVAHGEAGNFDPAIADYSQALALRPGRFDHHSQPARRPCPQRRAGIRVWRL